ncbi:MAG: TlpA family protein disulfide reductase [Deltaproteobacteria bacterium]|nr:TlpA family protein disulfide reductase [Deltaproteobacteria bacterium]
MNRTVRWVLIIITVQTALIGVYWFVEHRRIRDPNTAKTLGIDPPRSVNMTLPRLAVRRRDGSIAEISPPTRLTIVHFWATWCPPCRVELPGLLAIPTEHAVDVVAIALDKDWTRVDPFLVGLSATDVFLGNADEAEQGLDVRSLPVTFLLQPSGRIQLRFDGARDWTNAGFVQEWIGKLKTSGRGSQNPAQNPHPG